MTVSLSSLRLWQLISPALPIGAFSYSQGLEQAIDSGQLTTDEQVKQWLTAQMHHGLARLDVPVLVRSYQAWQQQHEQQVQYWNDYVLASRESAELLHEDQQVGYALARLLTDMGVESAQHWLVQGRSSYVTLFALGAVHWQIELQQACAGFVWAWSENMVAAAIKLLPMGQTAGQHLLMSLANEIDNAVQAALQCDDDDIGVMLPGVAMASALHETQYSRLFRS